MSIINITVEGQTEQAFCKTVLNPYIYNLSGNQVFATPAYSNKNRGIKGGTLNWGKIRSHITTWIRETPGQYHTMFFDLYALAPSFPGNDLNLSKLARAISIENSLAADVNNIRFIPYIQVHEFEALLFSDPDILEAHISKEPGIRLRNKPFHQILDNHNWAPEDINDGPTTAPSKRILSIHAGYQKVLDGQLIAKKIGINKMREKCPHFNDWINRLLSIPS